MMKKYQIILICLLLLVLPLLTGCRPASNGNQALAWVQQINTGGAGDEIGTAVGSDGDLYLAGQTTGTFPGNTSQGGEDIFVRRYDASKNVVWTVQLGTGLDDFPRGISIESNSIYLAGLTSGTFDGQTSAGSVDAFLARFNTDGDPVWVRQFGTPLSDYIFSICTGENAIYVAGYTYGQLPANQSKGDSDAFLARFDTDGNLVWMRQFGTALSDYAYGITLDEDGLYVTGVTYGSLFCLNSFGASDAFLARFDTDGNQVWARQFGTPYAEYANAVCADSGGVYIAGVTYGDFENFSNQGGADIFVARFDADGNPVSAWQLGTDTTDLAWGITTYSGKIFVTGYTYGKLDGQQNHGGYDGYVAVFDQVGSTDTVYQFGTGSDDYAKSLVVNQEGITVAGSTFGTFPDQTPADGYDAYIAHLP